MQNQDPVSSVFDGSSPQHSASTITVAVHDEEKQERPRPSPIPRSKRRGLLGFIVLIAEVEDANTYPRSTKWLLTWTMALMAWLAPLGGTIFYRECSS
jgi:hypothetical protein